MAGLEATEKNSSASVATLPLLVWPGYCAVPFVICMLSEGLATEPPSDPPTCRGGVGLCRVCNTATPYTATQNPEA